MIESYSDVTTRSRENSCEANDDTGWVRNPGAPPSPRNSEKEESSQKRGHATLMERSIDIIVLDDNPRAPKTVQGFVLTLRKRNSNNALSGFRKFVWKLGWLKLDSEQLSLYKTKDLSTTHMRIDLMEVVQVSVDCGNASVSVSSKDTNILFRLFDEEEAQEWRKCVHFNVNRIKTLKTGPKHAKMLGTNNPRASLATASPLTHEVIKIGKIRRKSLGSGLERGCSGNGSSDRNLPKHLQTLGFEAATQK